MTHLLAAIDNSVATTPVISVAQWFATLLDLDVIALHVSEDGDSLMAQAAADAAGVKFELRHGEPAPTIREAADRSDVRAVAIGARGIPAQRMPAGHVALDLIRSVAKPVIVVPPDVHMPRADRLRVLAPVDEDPASATALGALLEEMNASDIELVLLRVFDAEHIPMFANHEPHESEAFAKEFARRVVPAEAAHAMVETRVGDPAHTILAVERELASDVVVLAWGQHLMSRRASVVKRLLAHTKTPLVLLPRAPRECGTRARQTERGDQS